MITSKKILIVDDHALVRTGIKLLISKHYPKFILEEAENEDECILMIKQNEFDLVLLDLNMPDSDPFSIINYLNTRSPKTKSLIVTMNNEEIHGLRFFQAGVKGFINKGSKNENIIKAIETVLNGDIFVSPKTMENWVNNQINKKSINPFEKLSNREFQIAIELMKGKSIQEISMKLNISASTVSTFKAKIFAKLSIENNNLAYLIELGRTFSIIDLENNFSQRQGN